MVNYWDKYTEMHGQQNVKKPTEIFHMEVISVLLVFFDYFIFKIIYLIKITNTK